MAKYSVGDKIVIISETDYDDLELQDCGVIEAINNGWGKPFRVTIEGKCNKHSSLGTYYLTWYEFEKQKSIKKGEIKMKNKQLIKGYKVATVQFAEGDVDSYGIPICESKLVYYALYDDKVTVGDYVLCSTGHHGHIIAQVTQIFPNEEIAGSEVNYGREIICKIEYDDYVNRQKRIIKSLEIKKKMEKKRQELNELAIYKALAASSPEIAEMLKELEELL